MRNLSKLRAVFQEYESTLRRICKVLSTAPKGISIHCEEDEPLSISITLRNQKGRAYALTVSLEDLCVTGRNPCAEVLLFKKNARGDLDLIREIKLGHVSRELKHLLKKLSDEN